MYQSGSRAWHRLDFVCKNLGISWIIFIEVVIVLLDKLLKLLKSFKLIKSWCNGLHKLIGNHGNL